MSFLPILRFMLTLAQWYDIMSSSGTTLMIGWPIDGTEIMVKDEKEIFERVSLLSS